MKVCSTCKTEKPLDEFHRKGSGRVSKCKECAKKYHREHYLCNKQRYLERSASWRQKIKKMVANIKNVPCKDCGETYHPEVMEFDHLEGEEKSRCVSTMVGNTSVERLLAEIEKCEIVCANCHRMRTIIRRTA